jgi:hypothetical protein
MPIRSVFRATVTVAAAGLLAGCGSVVAGSGTAAGPASPSPASHSPASASPASPSPATAPTTRHGRMIVNPGGPMVSAPPGAGCRNAVPDSGVLILRNASNGGTYCVAVGQRVTVYLAGSASRRWAPIRSDATALMPAAAGRRPMMLPAGQTGATFIARHPGRVQLGSDRRLCASGPVRCDALAAYQVTIVVGGIEGSPAH